MVELNIAHQRAVIEGALSLLHEDCLGSPRASQTVRMAICRTIAETLGDNASADAVKRLVLTMAYQSIAGMGKLGLDASDVDFRQQLKRQ